ncbi:hypothetical protein EVAR_25585_1 [Eumeta japonica]|uniref:Uncharacterized protein n=1 Tax=Eumeta variegata TaxID=151549 RepID=A0A4C1V0Q9_EUMVA|nr:hypothetical protein EVAR_25585_1 [Eumeta japonica]
MGKISMRAIRVLVFTKRTAGCKREVAAEADTSYSLSSPFSVLPSSSTQLFCASSDSNVLFYSNLKLNANPRTLICKQGGRIPPMSPTPTTVFNLN